MAPQRLAQRVLEAIAAGCSGVAAIEQITGLSAVQVGNAVQVLRKRHLIEIPAPGEYRLTETGSAWLQSGRSIASGQAPRVHKRARGLRARAWWLMRELRKFTLTDLLTTLADGSEGDARGNLARYLWALEESGVVVRMKRRVPADNGQGQGQCIWYLQRDLGRLPPVARHTFRQVFDPNAGQVVGSEVATEVASEPATDSTALPCSALPCPTLTCTSQEVTHVC